MKIAITACGENAAAPFDSRFGRAKYFMLYDQDQDTWECLPNTQNLAAAHGAGIQAGQTLVKAGVDVLITGHIGPKAFKVLEAGKIKLYACGDMKATVKDVLAAFLAGKLNPISAPNGLEIKPSRQKQF